MRRHITGSAWKSEELLTEFKHKKHTEGGRRGATCGEYSDIAQACRDGAGKTRADPELKLELS